MQVKRISITVFSVLFSLLLPSFIYAQSDQPKVVSIPDANLAAAVREMIGDSITTHTLLDLTHLTAQERGIENLTGLEHARNLKDLGLYGNGISDISPLSGLTQLTSLHLADNNISDLSPLTELEQLTSLHLWGNNISDISPLAELKKLTGLYISNNNISDISALAELKQLTSLHIWENNISDISPIIELEKLTELYIVGNPLSYASINTHILALQAKGIEIGFSERVPTRFVKISESAQQGMVNSAFPLRFVVEVLDQGTRPFQGVPVTFTITAGDGTLTTADRITDATGKATALLKLGRTVGTTTLRVTAAHISESVEFTATAVLHSRPVYIPDTNLWTKIVETLGIRPSETLTPVDMLKLQTLTANDAHIHDLTGLEYASNLTFLSLANNAISDIVPLAGLPNLTTLVLDNNRISGVVPLAGLSSLTMLSLRNNWISDMSPLVDLTQLKSSQNGYGLDLRGNRLGEEAIRTHIPRLQAVGVKVGFDEILTESGPVVRLVYFLPRDRQPQPNINAKMDRLIKDTQKLYADEMERHGFGRKTFRFETDAFGNAVVYHIKGKFADREYRDTPMRALGEVNANFHTGKNTNLVVLDVSSEIIGGTLGGSLCGVAPGITAGGVHKATVLMPASGRCFTVSTAAHELGHAFGLYHDFRGPNYIMSYGSSRSGLSQCAAEWLDVHHYFNTNRATFKWTRPTIEMLPLSLASPPNAIRLRFKVTDPDGLHQAQLLINTDLTACQNLNGKTNDTVDFILTSLKPGNNTYVGLMVADVHGVLEVSSFPIDVTPLLPPAQPVLIPDSNLAAAIRQEVGDSITTHTLLNLTELSAPNNRITDLTGLEHAHYLTRLNLGGEYIQGQGNVNNNRVSDFSPLAGLTNLESLNLSYGSVSDVSSLAGLTNLTKLELTDNNISDISSLASLTNLTGLHLTDNNILDISPLVSLTNLTQLDLTRNNISDVSSLTSLTNLTYLLLTWNNISDVSPLTNLTNLTELWLTGNNISDVSPLANLTKLIYLYLGDNNISDVSPLVELDPAETELGNLQLELYINPLSYASINTHIPAMQAKGVKVGFFPRTYPALDIISGTGQQAAGGDTLTNPFVVAAVDARGAPMRGVAVTFTVIGSRGELTATTATTDASGRAETTLTLGPNPGKHHVRATAAALNSSVTFIAIATAPAARLAADVNDDGVVNIQDLVLVASRLGQTGQNVADINGDGVVNIQDLVLVASELDSVAAAPSAWHAASAELPSRATIEQWLAAAYRVPHTDARLRRGIDWLARFLAALAPKETALLGNYPNPFNPETWIPYQLSEAAAVTVRIYSVGGGLVRTLVLGHQPAGMYHRKSRAAYWDGRNAQGEKVASGIYFYRLSVGDFTATRRMVIRK